MKNFVNRGTVTGRLPSAPQLQDFSHATNSDAMRVRAAFAPKHPLPAAVGDYSGIEARIRLSQETAQDRTDI